MFKKTKIALAAVLLAGTATAASAQAFASKVHEFQSAPERLRSDRAFMPDANQVLEENNWIATNVVDRASSPYAGGGGK